ncbi:MAG: hypothetical protein A3F13_09390 [Gammaproteobacteria bacterium RIFCSPHIGHO2_12_FULL_40_19]|nr:MAG: hypothetical protein A3F13_09390 [Gammaproteobacteria bacterium RIFCSPHIGHO2_12_FULL_40_19]
MTKDVLIIGAGAIGRGFLPWVLPQNQFNLNFIDTDQKIISDMQKRRHYDTYKIKDNQLIKLGVSVKNAWLPEQFLKEHKKHKNFELIFVNVGPRNCFLATQLMKGSDTPTLVCENDPSCVNNIYINLKRSYFAIPDVITSNYAPNHILINDNLSVITEEGFLFYDDSVKNDFIIGNACNKTELEKHWIAKLYLHNTPHCVAAYLGALENLTYVHEVMHVDTLANVVHGCMNEMLQMLKRHWNFSQDFLDAYAKKELARFSNVLLYDPISRVAREPFRKLKLNGRLIGASQLCLSQGIVPDNTLIGIVSALLFESKSDVDQHLQFTRKNLSQHHFFRYILGLREGEALEIILNTRLTHLIEKTCSLMNNSCNANVL